MAAEVTIERATPDTARFIGEHMRPVEVDEVRAAGGIGPVEACLLGLEISTECWVARFDGEPGCIWGVTDLGMGDGSGCGWLLTTDAVERHPRAFWRECLRVVPELLDRWRIIVNAIDARHVMALRWAERLGFQLLEPTPFGVEGKPFHPWSCTKEDFQCAMSRSPQSSDSSSPQQPQPPAPR